MVPKDYMLRYTQASEINFCARHIGMLLPQRLLAWLQCGWYLQSTSDLIFPFIRKINVDRRQLLCATKFTIHIQPDEYLVGF